MSINFTTPIGRLVQGDPYTAQPRKNSDGSPKLNATTGQPEMQFYCALAIAKNDPAWPAFRESLMVEQRAAWPQFHNPQGQCTNPTFADKITDGDGQDSKGQSYATREGWPGHWIVKFASTFAPKVFEWAPELGAWKETEPGKVKLGDYCRISGTCQSNTSQQSPGMYMNLNMVAFEREGQRIVLGPTAEQAFGAPGSNTPTAPTPSPAPPAPTPPAPTAPPPPAYDGYRAGPVMLAAANGLTYESYKASGWTDEQLVQHGMMQAPAAA